MSPPPFQLFASEGSGDSTGGPPDVSGPPVQMVKKKKKKVKRSAKKRPRDESIQEEEKGVKKGVGLDGSPEKKKRPLEETKTTRRKSSRQKEKAPVDYSAMFEEEEEKKKKENVHDEFQPKDMKLTKKGNHIHHEYNYADGDAEFSGSDDSAEECLPRRIHGKNLRRKGKKLVGKRGRIHDGEYFDANMGENRSHLIADQFMGSGINYVEKMRKSFNVIPTSDQYNKVLMAKIENQVDKFVGNGKFDLQVYPYYFEKNDPSLIEEELKVSNPGSHGEMKDEIEGNVSKMNAKRVKKIVYELTTSKSEKYRGELGPDTALGTVNERKATGKKVKKKGKMVDEYKTEFKVNLRKVEKDPEKRKSLISDMALVDEEATFWDGDSSYRDYMQEQDDQMDVEEKIDAKGKEEIDDE